MKLISKSFVTSSLGLAILLTAAAVMPVRAEALRATVPFGFEAAGVTLPAGEYQIRIDSQARQAIFVTPSGSAHRVFISSDSVKAENANAGMLKFYRSGDAWHLSEVKSPGTSLRHTLPSRGSQSTAGMPIAMIRVW